ncbi:glycosyltransferase family 4 protein [Methylococcaceae bacterium WWC4]|nr:glycosyltransferase family 4 protein [Methylococcaceae bacterium WWC4]
MKLIYDARPIALEFTGLGRYTASLLRALLDSPRRADLQIDVLLDRGCDRNGSHYLALQPYLDQGACRLQTVDAPPISFRQHATVARWVNRQGADRYFYPHFDMPLGIKIPTAFVVHDLIPLLVDGYVQSLGFAKKLYFQQMLRHHVAAAQVCYAVSATTRRDILGLVGERWADKVRVAYEGPVLADGGDIGPPPLNSPYLLYVGDRRPHKNLRRIVDIFKLLRDRHGFNGRLALAGSRRNFDFDLDAYIADRTDIRVLGNVSDAELLALYAHTDALLFLSAYEGFGLPVVEAARFHRKIVLSDGGSLPEIAPPGACLIPCPLATDAAAEQIAAYLADPTQPELSDYNRRYTWRHAVEAIFPETLA